MDYEYDQVSRLQRGWIKSLRVKVFMKRPPILLFFIHIVPFDKAFVTFEEVSVLKTLSGVFVLCSWSRTLDAERLLMNRAIVMIV